MKLNWKPRLLSFFLMLSMIFSVLIPVAFALPPQNQELFNAISNQAPEATVRQLLEDHPGWVNICDSEGMLPIHRAAAMASIRGYWAALRTLVEKGADVNAPDKAGLTPLMCALCDSDVAKDDQHSVCKYLVKKGAQAGTVNAYNGSILHYIVAQASGYGSASVEFLYRTFGPSVINLEAEDDTADITTRTPLERALAKRKFDIAIELVELGADVNHKNSNGATLLFAVFDNPNEKLCENHYEPLNRFVDILRSKVTDREIINDKDSSGFTIWDYAGRQGSGSLARPEWAREKQNWINRYCQSRGVAPDFNMASSGTGASIDGCCNIQ